MTATTLSQCLTWCAALALLLAPHAQAQPRSLAQAAAPALPASSAEPTADRAELERTQITGSRELPKVITIVPWKKPVPGSPTGRPAFSVIDEVLAPVERSVLQRQIAFHKQLNPAPAATAAAAK